MSKKSRRIRVLLADDHSIVLEGLVSMLKESEEFEVVGQARDGVEAVKAASELSPDVIVMDVMMPGKDGVEACREIMETLPETRVVMLTASTEEDAVIEAVAAGATGYLQKVSGMDRLLSTLKLVAAGEMPVPPDVVRRVFARIRREAKAAAEEERRADGEGEGDACVVLPGHVLRRDCGGQGSQAGDHKERPLRHTEQAGSWHEAGDRGLGRAERAAG